MNVPQGFLDMVSKDIERLSNISNLSKEELLTLHREIDGRYQACIKNWYIGLWCVNREGTSLFYGQLYDCPTVIVQNLQMIKAKLETFQYQMNAIRLPEPASTQVNVTANLNVNVTFEQVRSQIEGMSSLTNEETTEILQKVSEIEDVVKSNDTKKSKWEKTKPVLKWLADKSCDVGIALLPLLMKIQG